VIEAEADHLDAVTTDADHVLTMKIVLTGGIMEEVEEIEEIEVVTAITVVLDLQWVVESVTITITWVVATATTIEEVVVVEQMPPKILSLLDAWECLAWGCTRLKQNYSMYLPNMDHLRKFK